MAAASPDLPAPRPIGARRRWLPWYGWRRWRRWQRVAALAMTCLLALAVTVLTYAVHEGYLPPVGGINCAADGFSAPTSYDVLVHQAHEAPYCARWQLGQTWG